MARAGSAPFSGARFTSVEQWLDDRARALLDRGGVDPASRPGRVRAALLEFLVFGAKQAWACLFGALMLAVIVLARVAYPDGVALARSDALTIAAVGIQALMLTARLETLRELRVIVLFHVVGTVMELFKTGVGSWEYDLDGVLHLGSVPLYTGFMYAAVGSYMVRVVRLFDLRFTAYPPRWLAGVIAALIYANFFTQHWMVDLRWVLLAAVVVVFLRTTMHVRVWRRRFRMPVLLAFALVALFIWFAENIGTGAGAWTYPDQVDGWHLVSPVKIVSWFLLMMISVALVTWVYPPQPPDPAPLDDVNDPVDPATSPSTRGRSDPADGGAAERGPTPQRS
ncbi:DUF817 domain-containing protein [Schumannella luteola]|uniref:Uncharacterized membrane protein YoaT (DUF817 family) n=1 Tax=Schumannella luteola TaxID=472059 RepID=A0A852YB97_9MICO|nr:DUF817 domain-containing protein [Schumannella luteola]NYH00227.1 uncharacterized membrane protein YoaT (DUF817 family) [Schumannella luteola]TPX04025.1 DUF817 domain-containing protein [Schumannella luteola]